MPSRVNSDCLADFPLAGVVLSGENCCLFGCDVGAFVDSVFSDCCKWPLLVACSVRCAPRALFVSPICFLTVQAWYLINHTAHFLIGFISGFYNSGTNSVLQFMISFHPMYTEAPQQNTVDSGT